MLNQVKAYQAFQHRHLDQLPLARPLPREQGGDGCMRAELRADFVANRGIDEFRHAAAAALHIRHDRHALNDIIIGRALGVRSLLAKADQRHIDQLRVGIPAVVIPQAQSFHRRRPHRCHQHIRRLHQFQQRIPARRVFQVQQDRALVAVGVEEKRTHARIAQRPQPPRNISAGRFDLDHIGAVIPQDLRPIRAETHRGQV